MADTFERELHELTAAHYAEVNRLKHVNFILERTVEFLLRELLECLFGGLLPTGLKISQGGNMITGVQVGGSATFQESYVPVGAALPPGAAFVTTWTVDDPLVTLKPAVDGVTVVATVDPTDTAKSFNLTATLTSAALPAPITSGPVAVPILPTPPPLPTSLSVDQIAAL